MGKTLGFTAEEVRFARDSETSCAGLSRDHVAGMIITRNDENPVVPQSDIQSMRKITARAYGYAPKVRVNRLALIRLLQMCDTENVDIYADNDRPLVINAKDEDGTVYELMLADIVRPDEYRMTPEQEEVIRQYNEKVKSMYKIEEGKE